MFYFEIYRYEWLLQTCRIVFINAGVNWFVSFNHAVLHVLRTTLDSALHVACNSFDYRSIRIYTRFEKQTTHLGFAFGKFHMQQFHIKFASFV